MAHLAHASAAAQSGDVGGARGSLKQCVRLARLHQLDHVLFVAETKIASISLLSAASYGGAARRQVLRTAELRLRRALRSHAAVRSSPLDLALCRLLLAKCLVVGAFGRGAHNHADGVAAAAADNDTSTAIGDEIIDLLKSAATSFECLGAVALRRHALVALSVVCGAAGRFGERNQAARQVNAIDAGSANAGRFATAVRAHLDF